MFRHIKGTAPGVTTRGTLYAPAVSSLRAWGSAVLAAVAFPLGLIVAIAGFDVVATVLGTAAPIVGAVAVAPIAVWLVAAPIVVWLIAAHLISELLRRGSRTATFWDLLAVSHALTFSPGLGFLAGALSFFLVVGLAASILPAGGSELEVASQVMGLLAACVLATVVGGIVERRIWSTSGSTFRRKDLERLASGGSLGWLLAILAAFPGVAMLGPSIGITLPLLVVASFQAWSLPRIETGQPRAAPVLEHSNKRGRDLFLKWLCGLARATAPMRLGAPSAAEGEGPMRDAVRKLSRPLALIGGLVLCGYVGFLAGVEFRPALSPRISAGTTEAIVYFAGQEIPAGTLIRPELVIAVPYPADLVVETMMTSEVGLLGAEAKIDIGRGMPLTEAMLTPADVIVLESTGRGMTDGSDIWAAPPDDVLAGWPITRTNDLQELSPILSPDGSRMVFTRFNEADNTMSLWVAEIGGSNERQLTEWWFRGEGSIAAHAWSPDGDKIYYVKDPGGGPCRFLWISAYAEATQEERPVIGAENKCQPDISPHGKRVVFRVYGQGVDLEIADLSSDGTKASNATVLVPANLGAELIEPEFSPDGERIAFGVDGTIYTVAADGSGLTRIMDFGEAWGARWSPDGELILVSINGDLATFFADGSGLSGYLTTQGVDNNPDW
jgi:hypothetical protein